VRAAKTTRQAGRSKYVLLSRGSQVRVLPGALFPKEFADSLDLQESLGEHKSKKVISLASSRHN
jgi:hypothetical protein